MSLMHGRGHYANMPQETLNYWKQLPHLLKYFRIEEDVNAQRPQNFMAGFLEVCRGFLSKTQSLTHRRAGIEQDPHT